MNLMYPEMPVRLNLGPAIKLNKVLFLLDFISPKNHK